MDRNLVADIFRAGGLSIANSFRYALVMSFGAPIGSLIGAFTADSWGRKPTILARLYSPSWWEALSVHQNPAVLMITGFLLTVPIYVLVALLFAIYIPELFPTEVRCGPRESATRLDAARRLSRLRGRRAVLSPTELAAC